METKLLRVSAAMLSPRDPLLAVYCGIASYAQFVGSLDWIAKEMPIKQDAEREHYLEGFRRAGLE